MYRWLTYSTLFILLLFTIAASSVSGYSWLVWLTILLFASSLALFESVFSGSFIFDPFYANYAKLTNPRY
jgi:hypothetical protein